MARETEKLEGRSYLKAKCVRKDLSHSKASSFIRQPLTGHARPQGSQELMHKTLLPIAVYWPLERSNAAKVSFRYKQQHCQEPTISGEQKGPGIVKAAR
jgi:hypothetical protein